MSERAAAIRAPGWLFCVAVVAAWLLGAELAVFTAIGRTLPDRLPGLAAWTIVVISIAFLVVIGRRQIIGGRQTRLLIAQMKRALGSFAMLTETSLGALPLDGLLRQLLERLDEVLDTDAAAILLSNNGCTFTFRASHGLDEGQLEDFGVIAGQGLIGSVVASRLPEALSDGSHLHLLTSQLQYRLASAAACPIVVENRLIGVCVVGASTVRHFDSRRLQLLQLVADRAGVEIHRAELGEAQRQSRADFERARRRSLTLAKASEVLLTAKNDYEGSLAALVKVVVPDLADWCRIDLIDNVDSQRTPAVGIVYRAYQEEDSNGIGSFEAVARLQRDPEVANMREAVVATGAPSFSIDKRTIVVAIKVASSVFATMVIGIGTRRASYETMDVVAAVELAERAAIAVERVQLYREARAAAEAAQHRALQLHQLVRASIEVQQARNGSEVLVRIVEWARRVFDAQAAVVTAAVVVDGPLQVVAALDHGVVVNRPDRKSAATEVPGLVVGRGGPWRSGEWLVAAVAGLRGTGGGTVGVRAGVSELNSDDEAVLKLLAQMTSIALDSTDLYHTIQTNEARWRVLVEAAPIGIVEVNVGGDIVWWNRAARLLFAWTDPPQHRNLIPSSSDRPDAADPDDEAPFLVTDTLTSLRTLWSEVAGGSEVIDRELLGASVGGGLRDLSISAAPLRAADGNVQGILMLVADVTDRRRLEADLRRAQRMEAVGQLAGGVAHDFNNLLTLIAGYTELLESHLANDPRSVELVDGIRAAAGRAVLLTGQLLTMSTCHSACRVVVDPAQSLRSLAEVLQRILGAGVELRLAFDPTAGSVHIDPTRLEQVILNLITNARDAMPGGGTVDITVAPVAVDRRRSVELDVAPGRYLSISVADSGTGMDVDQRRRCFDPLFTTKGPSHGNGIGLSAVKGVVEESGGSVRVDSFLGHGATFIVYLPAYKEYAIRPGPHPSQLVSAQADVAIPVLPTAVSVPVRTVLVAEDDEVLRHLMTRVLRRHGYRVLEAPDGREALVQAEKWSGRIDAMISDVVMPGMTGPDVVAKLTASRPTMRVLFVSGGADGSYVAAMPSDPLSFLAKPFPPSQLLTRLGQLLDS